MKPSFFNFRDRQFVYLLLDACLGGEVWTMIQNQGPFNERQSHFVIGCVIEAIDYLHSWGIVYRDLKPENLMTDDQGRIFPNFHCGKTDSLTDEFSRIRQIGRFWLCKKDWPSE